MITAQETLHIAGQQLQRSGCDTPRLDAEVLLMHTWKISRTQLIMRSQDTLPDHVAQAFQHAIEQRCQRLPVAYITGEKEFWSQPFYVTPDVLIPRPETEHLIEELLKIYPDRQMPYDFSDIGTGSGCIAVTLACEYPHATITASDISEKALAIAKRNAERHQVADRIHFKLGNLYAAFDSPPPIFDAIASNPPYVSLSEMEEIKAELRHEPRHALTDQHDGQSIIKALLKDAHLWLKEKGYLLIETGICGLPEAPESMPLQHTYHDLAGILRGAVYRRS